MSNNQNGWTALMLAADAGHIAIVKLLTEPEHGADVNRKKTGGETALMLAATKGHGEIVYRLLDKGADPKLTNKGDKTAYALAIKKGHLQVAALLKSWSGKELRKSQKSSKSQNS
jgi:ankyrin repeat protein